MRSFVWILYLLAPLMAGCSGKKDGEQSRIETIPLSARELCQEFDADGDGTKSKYRNRRIEVTGLCQHIVIDSDRRHHVVLEGGEQRSEHVNCIPRESEVWKKVLPGQTVKIRGKLDPEAFLPLLDDCEILEESGPRPRKVTVEEFLAECYGKPEVARSYVDKHFMLTGEVARIENKSEDWTDLIFKTKKPEQVVRAQLFRLGEEQEKRLNSGRRVTVLARFSPGFQEMSFAMGILCEVAP